MHDARNAMREARNAMHEARIPMHEVRNAMHEARNAMHLIHEASLRSLAKEIQNHVRRSRLHSTHDQDLCEWQHVAGRRLSRDEGRIWRLRHQGVQTHVRATTWSLRRANDDLVHRVRSTYHRDAHA